MIGRERLQLTKQIEQVKYVSINSIIIVVTSIIAFSNFASDLKALLRFSRSIA